MPDAATGGAVTKQKSAKVVEAYSLPAFSTDPAPAVSPHHVPMSDTTMLKHCRDLALAFGPFSGFLTLIALGTWSSLLWEKPPYMGVYILATTAMVLVTGVIHQLSIPKAERK